MQNRSFLVFGGTGRTGQHFVSLALKEGHAVRALVRDPGKVAVQNENLELHRGSITDDRELDDLLRGVDFVISMLGNARLQSQSKITLRL